jgi:hypothetical protein
MDRLCIRVAVLGTLLVVATAMSAYARDPAEDLAIAAGQKQVAPAAAAAAAAVSNVQTSVACNTCFTCGGDWPIFAGATHAVNTGGATFERGPACSGSLASANDTNPFLCCK